MAAKQELITRFSGDARPLTQAASRVKNIVSGLVMGAAGYGGYKLFVGSIKSAADFEAQMALVKGMLDGISDADFETLKGKIRAVVKELGATHEAGSEVAYMLASNAIAAKDIDTYTRAILGLSKALNADAGAVGQTLLRGMAARGMGADQVEHVTDVLAGMAKVGNMEGSDMAQYFSTFSSLAAAMEVDMEEAGAAFAIATREVEASQAATGMRALLSTLSRNNSALQEFDASGRIASKGLIAGVAELVQLADGNQNLLNQMFPEQNAKMMALIVANQADAMGDAMTRLRTDTQLFETMLAPVMDSTTAKFDQLKAQMADLGISFGAEMLPVAQELAAVLSELAMDPQFMSDVRLTAEAMAKVAEFLTRMTGGSLEAARGWRDYFGEMWNFWENQEKRDQAKLDKGAMGTTDQDMYYHATEMTGYMRSKYGMDSAQASAWEKRALAILDRIEANTAPREAQ